MEENVQKSTSIGAGLEEGKPENSAGEIVPKRAEEAVDTALTDSMDEVPPEINSELSGMVPYPYEGENLHGSGNTDYAGEVKLAGKDNVEGLNTQTGIRPRRFVPRRDRKKP